ncbi:MAG TPA: hypothetical protein VI306_01880 [Pyrinomonadaceae bacterium]
MKWPSKNRLLINLPLLVLMCSGSTEAQTLSPRAKRELIKRIEVKSEKFQLTLSKSLNSNPQKSIEARELIQFAEDLWLLIDGLGNRTVVDRAYTTEILRTAVEVELRLLGSDVSAGVVSSWSNLHAELDLLAKSQGIRWSDAVITSELIVRLESEMSSLAAEMSLQVGDNVCAVKPALPNLELADRRYEIDYSAGPMVLQVAAMNKRVHSFAPVIKNCAVNSRLAADWRRLSIQSEELMRLLSLDSQPPLRQPNQTYTKR